MTDENLIHHLRNSKGWPTLGNAAADRIEALRAALDEAEAERHRWRQAAEKGSLHTQADLDRAVNEARAVALQEAAEWHKEVIAHDQGGLDYASAVGIPISNDDDLRASVAIHEYALNRILALIDTPAAEALERVRAEAYLSGWVNGSNGVEPPDFGSPVFDAAAIRARGETRDLITCSTLDGDWVDAKTYGYLPRKASEGET